MKEAKTTEELYDELLRTVGAYYVDGQLRFDPVIYGRFVRRFGGKMTREILKENERLKRELEEVKGK